METERQLDTNDDIEIIDAGLEPEDLIGPNFVCCWGAIVPFSL